MEEKMVLAINNKNQKKIEQMMLKKKRRKKLKIEFPEGIDEALKKLSIYNDEYTEEELTKKEIDYTASDIKSNGI